MARTVLSFLQWGQVNGGGGYNHYTQYFPLAFPNSVYSMATVAKSYTAMVTNTSRTPNWAELNVLSVPVVVASPTDVSTTGFESKTDFEIPRGHASSWIAIGK